MNSPASSPTSRFGRRVFLTGITGAVLTVSTACDAFSSGTRTTTTVTAEAPVDVDPLPSLIAISRFHLARIDAVIATNSSLAGTLAGVRQDRSDHIDALVDELERTTGITTPPTPPDAADSINMPTDPVDALTEIRADAGDDQLLFNDALARTTRFRAALYGSISACLACHRSVLV